MAYTIIGTLTDVGPIIPKTEKFRMREFVIMVEKTTRKQDLSYPVKLQVINDRCDQLDYIDFKEALKYEMNVEVEFEVSGRLWRDGNGKTVVFNSLTATFIKIMDRIRVPSPAVQGVVQPTLGLDSDQQWIPQKPAYIAPDAEHAKDDLPF